MEQMEALVTYQEFENTLAEIERCRDCRWMRQDPSEHEARTGWWCDVWCTDVPQDGYCWRGRREE